MPRLSLIQQIETSSESDGERPLSLAVSDTCLAQIVWRHFHFHSVADGNANEILTHLAGDMREHFMTIGKGDTKHRPGQDLGY